MRKLCTILIPILSVWLIPQIAISKDIAKDEPGLATYLVSELSDNLKKTKLNVKIGPICLKGTKLSGKFADYLISMIQMAMSHDEYKSDFASVERARADGDSINTAVTRGIKTRGGLYSYGFQDNEKETTALLTGTYHKVNFNNRVLVRLHLEGQDGKTISQAESEIEFSSISVPLEAANKESIKNAEGGLDKLTKPKSEFKVNIWIDKGNGAVYKNGDELKLFFRTAVMCYLKVLYVDAGGNKILMYPTVRDSKSLQRTNITHELHALHRYIIKPPFGSEMIVAFASTKPFSEDKEISLNNMYRGFKPSEPISHIGKRYRGLDVIGKDEKDLRSEARIFLTTVE
jgi:Domain of unknown function (DUF4384)